MDEPVWFVHVWLITLDQEVQGPVAILFHEFLPSGGPPIGTRKRQNKLRELILAVAPNRPKIVEEINRMVKRETLEPRDVPRIIRRTIKNIITQVVTCHGISRDTFPSTLFKPVDGFLIDSIQNFFRFPQ